MEVVNVIWVPRFSKQTCEVVGYTFTNLSDQQGRAGQNRSKWFIWISSTNSYVKRSITLFINLADSVTLNFVVVFSQLGSFRQFDSIRLNCFQPDTHFPPRFVSRPSCIFSPSFYSLRLSDFYFIISMFWKSHGKSMFGRWAVQRDRTSMSRSYASYRSPVCGTWFMCIGSLPILLWSPWSENMHLWCR